MHFDVLADFKSNVTQTEEEPLDIGDLKSKTHELLMCVLLKQADIAHATKHVALHTEWSDLIQKEFFEQGDLEIKQGLPVGMMNDRAKVIFPNSQLGFFQFLVNPIFQEVSFFLKTDEAGRRYRLEQGETSPGEDPWTAEIANNMRHWEFRRDADEAEAAAGT